MTGRQRAILDFIDAYWAANWTSPTVREITRAMGLSAPSTAAHHLERLTRMGLLERKALSVHRVLYRLTDEALDRGAGRGL